MKKKNNTEINNTNDSKKNEYLGPSIALFISLIFCIFVISILLIYLKDKGNNNSNRNNNSSVTSSIVDDHDAIILNEKLISFAQDNVSLSLDNAEVTSLISFGFINNTLSYTCYVSDVTNYIATISFDVEANNINDALKDILEDSSFNSDDYDVIASYQTSLLNSELTNNVKSNLNISNQYTLELSKDPINDQIYVNASYKINNEYKSIINYLYSDIATINGLSASASINPYLYKLLYYICA